MDLKKMKIDHFSRFLVQNFPKEYSPGLDSVKKDVEVILFFINSITDVKKFVELCESVDLNKENRVIMVFEKGRKDGVNRDSIFMPFKNGEYFGFKMKAPMLCSISDKLSAFVQQKVL
jgi:hypothetical protein